MSDDATRLLDMLGAAEEALDYLTDYSREDFLSDKRTIRACERCIEIIGEAASKVSEDLQRLHPELPWHRAKGMRNIIIHEYGAVQYDLIYETIVEHLPNLIQQIKSIVKG
jgi:uncharacterized protein with HEPN domain